MKALRFCIRTQLLFLLILCCACGDNAEENKAWTALIHDKDSANSGADYIRGGDYPTKQACENAAVEEVKKIIEKNLNRIVTEAFVDVSDMLLFNSSVEYACGNHCGPDGSCRFVSRVYDWELAGAGDSKLNTLDVPDKNFKKCILKTAVAEQWELPEDFTHLYCDNYNISSISGLENFIGLKTLSLGGNKIKNIDVSKNINLVDLYVARNELVQVDVSANVELVDVDLSFNNIVVLDVTNNKSLASLIVFRNELNALRLDNPNLRLLNVNHNQLKSLDLNRCPKLNNLEAESNGLMNLKMSSKEVDSLYLARNRLEELDLSEQTKLERLDAKQNNLKVVKLGYNDVLFKIDLSQNDLSEVDLSGVAEIKHLNLSHNNLSEINLSSHAELRDVNIEANYIEKLDLTRNLNLANLIASNNRLVAVDLDRKVKLSKLYLDDNLLKDIQFGDFRPGSLNIENSGLQGVVYCDDKCVYRPDDKN